MLNFLEPRKRLEVASLFVQDEVELTPNLGLTLGLKGEHSSYSGTDYLPSMRLAWRPQERTLLWASVSRAVRTPNRVERELQGAGVLALPPDYRSEKATSFEAGYRGQPAARATLTLNAFYNRYDDIRSSEHAPGGLPIFLGNGLKGETWGASAWATLDVTSDWRLRAGGAILRKDFHRKPESVDVARQALGYDPRYQAQLRSEANLAPGVSLDVALRTVGQADDPATGLKRVAAYTEADARLAWRIRPAVELSLAGFNLLHDEHLEYDNPDASPVRRIPRSAYVGLRWGF